MDNPGGEHWHGTFNGYTRYRCRCQPCKDAAAAYRRQSREDIKAGRKSVRTHSAAGFTHGCRCDVCRTAFNEWGQERRKAIRSGEIEVPSHGLAGYVWGCRCDVCREGQRQRSKADTAARRAAGGDAPSMDKPQRRRWARTPGAAEPAGSPRARRPEAAKPRAERDTHGVAGFKRGCECEVCVTAAALQLRANLQERRRRFGLD